MVLPSRTPPAAPIPSKRQPEAVAGKTDKAIILITEGPTCMEAAAGAIAARKPLLYAATADNYEKMVRSCQESGCSVGGKGNGPE